MWLFSCLVVIYLILNFHVNNAFYTVLKCIEFSFLANNLLVTIDWSSSIIATQYENILNIYYLYMLHVDASLQSTSYIIY